MVYRNRGLCYGLDCSFQNIICYGLSEAVREAREVTIKFQNIICYGLSSLHIARNIRNWHFKTSYVMVYRSCSCPSKYGTQISKHHMLWFIGKRLPLRVLLQPHFKTSYVMVYLKRLKSCLITF